MVFLLLVFNWSLRCFSEGWEKCDSDLGNSLLVGESHSVIQSLGTHDSVLFCVDNEAAKTRILLISFIPVGQKVLLIDSNFAWNISLTLQRTYLLEHKCFVSFD